MDHAGIEPRVAHFRVQCLNHWAIKVPERPSRLHLAGSLNYSPLFEIRAPSRPIFTGPLKAKPVSCTPVASRLLSSVTVFCPPDTCLPGMSARNRLLTICTSCSHLSGLTCDHTRKSLSCIQILTVSSQNLDWLHQEQFETRFSLSYIPVTQVAISESTVPLPVHGDGFGGRVWRTMLSVGVDIVTYASFAISALVHIGLINIRRPLVHLWSMSPLTFLVSRWKLLKGTRVLVICDYLTKWVEAFSLADHRAATVADVLLTEIFLWLGVPSYLHSDQGPEFMFELMTELCELLEVHRTRTTPYCPQSDGLVERFDRTLIDMLSKFCNEKQDDWDQHLPCLMCAYRSSVNESTGCTLNLLVLGRETALPVDLMYLSTQYQRYRCHGEYVEWIKQALQDGYWKGKTSSPSSVGKTEAISWCVHQGSPISWGWFCSQVLPSKSEEQTQLTIYWTLSGNGQVGRHYIKDTKDSPIETYGGARGPPEDFSYWHSSRGLVFSRDWSPGRSSRGFHGGGGKWCMWWQCVALCD